MPLSVPWEAELPEGHFRSGNSPIEAIYEGVQRISSGALDAVVIRGEEPLKSGYSRDERHKLMDIYDGVTIPEGYQLVAEGFLRRRGLSHEWFKECAEALFDNYLRTYEGRTRGPVKLPGIRWYEPVTPLFRGVDCANPIIDYSGQILLTTRRGAAALGLEELVEVEGVGLGEASGDGPDNAEEISAFTHLSEAIRRCERAAGLSIKALMKNGFCAIELYICYPVVPLAFLLASGAVPSADEVIPYLERQPITITGGMNLARAPWNCPALRAAIAVYREMLEKSLPYGLIHGNGGLGYKQGVAILAR
ncbi:MAG: hypothetical protein C0608_08200 [Deltaproteobacteria bacterium]|nr:MAG: hypothetical protein C0608_08200 [Deltaproteobacteria bacterium]